MSFALDQTTRRVKSWAASVMLLAGASACAAAAAGAGAAGAVYLTNNGAEARIEAGVDQTFEAAREALQELNVTLTETSQTAAQPADTAQRDQASTKRELEGKAGDRDVKVTIEEDGSTTKVEVTAKTSEVTWDKDFAKSVLEEIIEKTQD